MNQLHAEKVFMPHFHLEFNSSRSFVRHVSMGIVLTDTILKTNFNKRWLFIHRNLSKNSGEACERIEDSFPNPTFIKVTHSLNKSFCH